MFTCELFHKGYFGISLLVEKVNTCQLFVAYCDNLTTIFIN